MNEKRFLEFFKETDWRYLFIEGSSLGNTSFLMQFLKLTILGEANEEDNKISKLLDEQIKILYFRPQPLDSRDKSKMERLNSISLLEFISESDAFNPTEMMKYLRNRPYNYLIIDDVRKDSDSGSSAKFDELLKFCESKKIKVIVSVTDNRNQKIDYNYYAADLGLEVTPYIMNNHYSVTIEQKSVGYKSYTIGMK